MGTVQDQQRTPLGLVLATAGLTADEAARRSGLHPATVRAAVAGTRPVRRRTVVALSEGLGRAADELFPNAGITLTPLDHALADAGLTVDKLARRARVHPNSVDAWLWGRGNPDRRSAQRVAEVLDVPAVQLFPAVADRLQAPAPEPRRDPRVERARVTELLTRLATRDPNWEERASCATEPGADPEWWWPGVHKDERHRAEAVCQPCPVLGDCRELFLSDPRLNGQGVWAGMRGSRLRGLAARDLDRGRDRGRAHVSADAHPRSVAELTRAGAEREIGGER